MKREALKHPKMYDLAAKLWCELPAAIGYMTLLLDFAGSTAPQGDIGKWNDEAIARACEWRADAAQFVRALRETRWLDDCLERRLIVHDWEDHCEEWVRKRLQRSALPYLKPVATASRRRRDNGSPPSVTKPSLANPIQSKDSSEPGCAPNSEPAVLSFPTVGNGPSKWHLTQAAVDRMAELYPGLDVLGECRKAVAWCEANPAKRKTARGMPSFLNRWLTKVQDRWNGFDGPRKRPSLDLAKIDLGD
jgi:hypothetical protein